MQTTDSTLALAPTPAKALQYETMIGSSPEARADLLKQFTGTKDSVGDFKKTTAKILAAMIAAKDCDESKIRETAEKITGVDIREIFQGVYELRVVFSALVSKIIDLTEDEFDSIGSSILGLLSPFIQKDELKPLLPEAVKLAKSGTAKQIRELKPKTEPKEPKAVKEQREKAEAAETKAAQAEERAAAAEARAKAIEETYTVKCQFAITDLKSTATPILESDQLRNRLKRDLLQAKDSGNEESLLYQNDKLAKAFYGSCQLLGIDPVQVMMDIASELATSAKGKETAATATIEVVAAAA